MSNIINFITKSSIYLIFGLWSSYIVQENNYNTKMKDIDAIVQDMTNKYNELFEKMKNLETRVAKLEDDLETEKNINKIKLEEHVEELEELEEIILEEIKEIKEIKEIEEIKEIKELEQEEKDKELIQMMNEDIKIITDEIVDEIIENEPSVSIASKSLDD